MNITLFSNTSWSIYHYRKDLLKFLISKNHKINIISRKDYTTKKIENMGCKFHELKIKPTSTNFFYELKTILQLTNIIKKNKSDIYINITIKPAIYFGIINFFFEKKAISIFDGLGRSFINKNFLYYCILFLLKISQKKVSKVIVVNNDDKNFFIKKNIVKKNKITKISAPGININDYNYKPKKIKKLFVFSFISRVLIEKGIYHFVEAAKIIKKKYKAVFFVIGKTENIKILNYLRDAEKNGLIKYFFHQKNIKKKIYETNCVVLPSYYREGLPRILQEACSMGTICITTNNVGCRDIIKNNYNGFICKKNSTKDLVNKISKVLKLKTNKLNKMQKNSANIIKKKFNCRIINQKLYRLICHVEYRK